MLIFLAMNQYTAIGFVLTAKSIARYDKITKDEKFAEYYLLGTLISTLCVVICRLLIIKWCLLGFIIFILSPVRQCLIRGIVKIINEIRWYLLFQVMRRSIADKIEFVNWKILNIFVNDLNWCYLKSGVRPQKIRSPTCWTECSIRGANFLLCWNKLEKCFTVR